MSLYARYQPFGLGGGGGGGIAAINSDHTALQTLAVGTAGSDFAIVDNGSGTHTFNLPTASASERGALSAANWTTFNNKANSNLGNLSSTALNTGLTFAVSPGTILGEFSSAGGGLNVIGGNGSAGAGGSVFLRGGYSTASGSPASLTVDGVHIGSDSGSALVLVSGDGFSTGNGGNISISAGAGGVSGGNGGNITLRPGSGGGVNGKLFISNTATSTGASLGTLTNSPTAGNPAGFLQVTINGTVSYIPYWQ